MLSSNINLISYLLTDRPNKYPAKTPKNQQQQPQLFQPALGYFQQQHQQHQMVDQSRLVNSEIVFRTNIVSSNNSYDFEEREETNEYLARSVAYNGRQIQNNFDVLMSVIDDELMGFAGVDGGSKVVVVEEESKKKEKKETRVTKRLKEKVVKKNDFEGKLEDNDEFSDFDIGSDREDDEYLVLYADEVEEEEDEDLGLKKQQRSSISSLRSSKTSRYARSNSDSMSSLNQSASSSLENLPIHNTKTITPSKQRSNKTGVTTDRRKEAAKKHYERNKEKRRLQMKEYQRVRRADPNVRLKHNETERKRLQMKRKDDSGVKTPRSNTQPSYIPITDGKQRLDMSSNHSDYSGYDEDFSMAETFSSTGEQMRGEKRWHSADDIDVADLGGLARAA